MLFAQEQKCSHAQSVKPRGDVWLRSYQGKNFYTTYRDRMANAESTALGQGDPCQAVAEAYLRVLDESHDAISSDHDQHQKLRDRQH